MRIVFRGDSGFCRPWMLRLCERNGVDYIVGIVRNSRLEVLGSGLREETAELFGKSKRHVKLFGEFMYEAGAWEADLCVVVKAKNNARGPNYRCVETSLEGDGWRPYEKVYCMYNGMENRIKEQLPCLFASRTSSHAFDATSFGC